MEKLLKNEIQTSYWYLYEYIGILMMLPFLGAIARNVDLDCMKYFLGLGLIIKVGMSIVGQFTGYSMPMSFLYCRIMFFMFCWDIFWKEQLVQKNADSFPGGSYRLVWQ